MRDTPRTDEAAAYRYDPNGMLKTTSLVSADFARQLERELAAAQARVAGLELEAKSAYAKGMRRAAEICTPSPGPEGRDWQIERAIRACKQRLADYIRKEVCSK